MVILYIVPKSKHWLNLFCLFFFQSTFYFFGQNNTNLLFNVYLTLQQLAKTWTIQQQQNNNKHKPNKHKEIDTQHIVEGRK